jgi:hypothetical protein
VKTAEKKKPTYIWVIFVAAGFVIFYYWVIPSKRDYGNRAMTIELIAASWDCRARIAEHLKSASGALPAGGQWGCESRVAGAHPIKMYVEKIETNEYGDVRGTFAFVDQDDISKLENPISEELFGKMLILRPSTSQDTYAAPITGKPVVWYCGYQAGQDPDLWRYLMGMCRNEITPRGTFAESSN